jgi:group I intron endonuclease
MEGIIYKITNKVNNKIYIGQTIKALEYRFYHHIYDSVVKKQPTRIGRAIRKYGPENFSAEIIEKTNKLDEREKFYIDKYKTTGLNGYNIKIGGNGGPHDRTTKRKISKANTKRVWTEEMRKNMSDAIKLWHQKRGFVPRSEEFKKRISEANTGRKMSNLTRQIFQEHNRKLSKPVICLDTRKEYPSILAACKDMNLNDGHLRTHLKGKYSHVKGFHFKFK